MRCFTTVLSLAVLAALTGCGSVVVQGNPDEDGGVAVDGSTTPDVTPTDDRPPPSDRPTPVDVPATCVTTRDCAPGLACLGGEGCGVPWTCQPGLGRPCTDDLAPFCACTGVTFYGSSTCPTQPYAHRGPCEMPPPPIDGGPNPDGCALPDGRVCPVGAPCVVGECTTCFCVAPGVLRCTGGCVDAGPPPRVCRGNVDCPAGSMCSGPEGCGVPWTCQPVSACTRDLGPYCACDGSTFMASSTCPGRPYLHRGNCGIVPPPVDAGPATCVIGRTVCTVGVPCRIDACTVCVCNGDSVSCGVTPDCAMDAGVVDAGTEPPPLCPADDARGVGNCAAFFGYAWDGSSCVGLGGCSCAGTACGALTFSRELCEYEHRACPRPI